MSKNIKRLAGIALIVAVAACAKQEPVEEYVVVEPEPISQEPTYTGTLK